MAARLADAARTLRAEVAARFRRGWNNPLLSHARRLNPLPIHRTLLGLAFGCLILTVAATIAWAGHARLAGAALTVLSAGAVLLPLLVAPILAADRVAGQMRSPRLDPRRLTNIKPEEVAWGLTLVTFWKLRWLIVVGLALTPALMVSVLRISLAEFQSWRDSAAALGDAAAMVHPEHLLPGGRIPFVRGAIQAVGTGILPWMLLPLMASGGVAIALLLHDRTLSTLAALMGQVTVALVVGTSWTLIARTSLFSGMFEWVRLLLLGGVATALLAATAQTVRFNASLVSKQR